MQKKQKVLNDNKPTRIPENAIEQARYYSQLLLEYCVAHDITCIISVCAYDRITRKEPSDFSFCGPKSSILGLQMLTADKIEEEYSFSDDFDDDPD